MKRKTKENKSHANESVDVVSDTDTVTPPHLEVDGEEGTQEVAPTAETAEQRITSLEDTLLRAKAELQNVQRRSVLERSDAIRYANTDLIRSLLGVLDDFERAMSAEQDGDGTAMADGLKLIHDNFLKAMTDRGLQPIESLHLPFDPHIHEALMQQASDEHPAGTVIQELARGYKLHDRVVRPAKVIVASAPQQSTGEETADGEESTENSA